MEISVRFVGKTVVEITFKALSASITEDIADVHGVIDNSLIDDLEEVIEELRTHNAQIKAGIL